MRDACVKEEIAPFSSSYQLQESIFSTNLLSDKFHYDLLLNLNHNREDKQTRENSYFSVWEEKEKLLIKKWVGSTRLFQKVGQLRYVVFVLLSQVKGNCSLGNLWSYVLVIITFILISTKAIHQITRSLQCIYKAGFDISVFFQITGKKQK